MDPHLKHRAQGSHIRCPFKGPACRLVTTLHYLREENAKTLWKDKLLTQAIQDCRKKKHMLKMTHYDYIEHIKKQSTVINPHKVVGDNDK